MSQPVDEIRTLCNGKRSRYPGSSRNPELSGAMMGPNSSSSRPMKSLNRSSITREKESLLGMMEMSQMKVEFSLITFI